jgi:predicted nucleotidyltransferase
MAARREKDKARLNEIVSALRKELPNLEKQFRVESLGVFGPYARGTHRPHSALNLVVEYEKTPNLIEMAQLEEHLQDLLGLKVDLGIKGDLRPHVREQVLRELVDV